MFEGGWATAILSGLRQGELLGLHWRDVDFDNEVIRVRTALNRKRQDVPPKTERAVRDVILMPALAQLLRQHKRESRFNAPDDYVFATSVGTPEHAAHISLRSLKPALARAGLRPIGGTTFDIRSPASDRRRSKYHVRLSAAWTHLEPDHARRLCPPSQPRRAGAAVTGNA